MERAQQSWHPLLPTRPTPLPGNHGSTTLLMTITMKEEKNIKNRQINSQSQVHFVKCTLEQYTLNLKTKRYLKDVGHNFQKLYYIQWSLNGPETQTEWKSVSDCDGRALWTTSCYARQACIWKWIEQLSSGLSLPLRLSRCFLESCIGLDDSWHRWRQSEADGESMKFPSGDPFSEKSGQQRPFLQPIRNALGLADQQSPLYCWKLHLLLRCWFADIFALVYLLWYIFSDIFTLIYLLWHICSDIFANWRNEDER